MNYLKIIFLVLFAMFWQVKSHTEHLSKNFARFHCYKLLHCVPGGVSLCTQDFSYRLHRYVDLVRFPDKCSFYSANCRQLGEFWVLEEDKCKGWLPYNEQWYLDRSTKKPTEPTEAPEQNTPRSDEDTEPATTVSDTTVTTASSKDTEPVTTISATTFTTASSKDTEPVTTVSATTFTTASSKDTEPVTTVSATAVTTASSKDTEPVTTVSATAVTTASSKDTEPVTTVSATTVTTASSKDTEPVTTVSATTVTTASSKDTEPVTTVSDATFTTASSKDTEPVTTVSDATVTTVSSKDTEPVTTVSEPEGLRTPSEKDAIERARFLRHILKNMNFGLLNSN